VLAVGIGKTLEALPFFQTALETKPDVAQFWLSYIEALIKLGRLADAKTVLHQAMKKGFKSDAFAQLQKRLSKASKNPQHPPAEQIQAIMNLYNQGRLQQALFEVNKMLERFPNSFILCNIAGASNAGLMQFDAAIDFFKRSLKVNPGNAEAYNNIGNVLNSKGNPDAALDYFKKALKIKPKFADVYNNIGNALNAKGDTDAAIGSYKKALKIKPDYAEAYYNKGIALKDKGEQKAAIDSYKRAIKIKPDYADAYSNTCELYERSNKLAELSEVISIAKAALKKLPSDLLYYEALYNYRSQNYDHCETLIGLINIDQLAATRTSLFWQLRAKLEQHQKNYNAAFISFTEMNNTYISSPIYNAKQAQTYFDELLMRVKDLNNALETPYCQNLEESSADVPIFLIGFPRSGTTLLDTILRTHSKISVVEEKNMLSQAKKYLGNNLSTFDIENLTSQELLNAREVYFEELSKHVSTNSSGCVIDKFPLNIVDVPIIHKLFPTAKFILALRHPLDSILSCWMQPFQANDAMANMVELSRIVDFYAAAMTVLELSEKRYQLTIHRIRYEDLVLDMKTEVSNLLNFLELDWENELENYQQTALNRGIISTPSYSQVIQPLYKTASNRWVKYQESLKKYFIKIEKWTTKFGYEL
jgi:tetratricopeptide (TPR) repeat protein